jgi:hypothetical protein
MNRYLCAALTLGLISAVIPVRAASRPRAGTDHQGKIVWTNDDLDRVRDPGLICIVGRMDDETSKSTSLPQPYLKTRDPEWYAEQAARLRDELERRKAQLDEYRQAIGEATSLKTTTSGINLDEGDIGVTPEAGIEILQQGVSEARSEFDALEDQARRNDIEPGTLRAQ